MVTTTILGDVVENVVGDELEVVTIMPVGADPHDFQASAQQVAEIGDAIDAHMRMIGMIEDESLDDHQRQFVESKRKEFEKFAPKSGAAQESDSSFPAGASLCGKCQTKAMVMMDGCMTCLNCGDSKCG